MEISEYFKEKGYRSHQKEYEIDFKNSSIKVKPSVARAAGTQALERYDRACRALIIHFARRGKRVYSFLWSSQRVVTIETHDIKEPHVTAFKIVTPRTLDLISINALYADRLHDELTDKIEDRSRLQL